MGDSLRSQLEPLRVIDCLEIGPVSVEARKLSATYRLIQGDSEDSTTLSYVYDEDVFDPTELESQNLATMIAAQVGINYGLFCKEIQFLGVFDQVDQRFITDAVENTSREIYVKKLLEPNPFLVGEAAGLKPVKAVTYTQAKLHFSEPVEGGKLNSWETSFDRYAVLSSGGKDSLLSFGLLKEMGHEVHPIFGNESGRHWFTALNAHRYFKERIPNTARVWMNSDRVFAWMLRHLPFIRANFANVRSDEYPVRLWTVAVFLFGAMPLLRKRGIGRLVIGDEYDTTHRTSFRGITNYDGLYDQSRYFDQSLTRYFFRKNWSVQQFSILRPLSELLVQKTLVERYPDLQAQQVSCHSAHQEGDRIKPCGKCEKCRRIVAMLTALGADPSACGYSAQLVGNCLDDFVRKGIHQEKAGAQHLEWLLTSKQLIRVGKNSNRYLKPRPEVLSLRFDREHSPLNNIPATLRKTLYRIVLNHAESAVKRSGRLWLKLDPFSEECLTVPYLFEKTGTRRDGKEKRDSHFLLGHLTWKEAEDRLKLVDIALLPVGATEQHGPHLPLDTDAFDASYLAEQVALRCSGTKPLVLPLLPYGVSYHHEDFSGTISISNETLSRIVYEIGMSIALSGVTKLLIINGHGGNDPALNFAAQMINRDAHIFVCVDSGETSDVDILELIDTRNDVHAGEIETSTSLATRPKLVQLNRAEKFVPQFSSRYLNFTAAHRVSWYAYTRKISPVGVMGDPTKASVEKGERIWNLMIDHLTAFVEDLKRLTLDEIYQRRY